MVAEATQLEKCPKCGKPAAELTNIDPGTKLILQQSGFTGAIPARSCVACYNALTGQVSQGAKLRIEQQARDKNRHMLWKSRVNLIKHARQMMAQKSYTEAAISYEKYLRVLEISYDLKPGQLSPDVFGKSSRSKELSIIANTYWDLLRIYDTHSSYRERMMKAAKKLAQFIPYSPSVTEIIKKAQTLVTTAKNPDIVKDFLKMAKSETRRCFIATSAFESDAHPTVVNLRLFRDAYLKNCALGRVFITSYEYLSPTLANWMDRNTYIKPFIRNALRGVTKFLPKGEA